MSNERYLCALFTMEGFWGVNQMLLVSLSELKANSFYLVLFLAKTASLQGHVPISSGCILDIFFNSFECSLSWSTDPGFQCSSSAGGRNKPWKRFVPAWVSNGNLRTFKDARIHLMHTYQGLSNSHVFPFNCQLEKPEMTSFENRIVSEKALHTVFQPAWN